MLSQGNRAMPQLFGIKFADKPPPYQLGGLGEHCKLPSGVRGGASENLDFGAFWDLRNHVRTMIDQLAFESGGGNK